VAISLRAYYQTAKDLGRIQGLQPAELSKRGANFAVIRGEPEATRTRAIAAMVNEHCSLITDSFPHFAAAAGI
jgi:hypothetical protein